MDKPIIQLDGLSKRYGKARVLEDFGMSVEKGHIHGLIGPNGAGKTTIMRIMAGLTTQDKGDMEFFGDKEKLNDERRRMSFMIEAPIIDGGMTAWQNMCYVRYVKGVADEKRIDEVLDYVGLGNVGKKRAKNFSLGMKQRLGIAMALLSKPEVMVLDEPVNGLDPEGIVDVRNMLKRLSEEQGVTIIISSHLLSELSELCSDFTIISRGKLVESFSAEELSRKCRNHFCIRTDDINKTAAVLENTLGVHEYKVIHGEEIYLFEYLDDIMAVSRAITNNGLTITKLCTEGESLEQYYLSKVGGINE